DVRCEKQPWTETIWRQSLRGAGFRNLALPAHLLQALPLHDDLLGATAPFHYDVNLPVPGHHAFVYILRKRQLL
ncbi:hypothetical protein EA430_014375, partial [Escherichia coli]